MKRLYLGEGPESKPEEDKIRIDIVKEWADIHCDLNVKIPKLEGKFSYIEAHHLFEHIESTKQLKKIMQWCFDILEEGGTFDITVPHWKSDSAVECIEHCRFFNENSFMNYYSNPYAKEMGLPQFKHLLNEKRPHGAHEEVHVILSK
jgi:predicted SAM-dependent methyltransferase